MGQFSTFVIAYREAMAASSSAAQGLVNAAANINHCYASVKLWLLLERMLSRAPPSQQGGHSPVPRAGPFVIWNELWPPFSILVNAHEAEVSKGQNTVRATPGHSPSSSRYLNVQPLWSAISSAIADLFHFLKEFHSVLALETAVHEATLSRLRASGQPDGSKSKVDLLAILVVTPLTSTHGIVSTNAGDYSRTGTKSSMEHTS
jgi:hypothetical protein